MPAVPACATKVAGLSTSLMVSVPEVEVGAALVSVRLRTSADEHRGVVGAEDVDGDRGGGAVGAATVKVSV